MNPEPEVAAVLTPEGDAHALVSATGPDWLVLGHGAGGRSWSRDLLDLREQALGAGWSVLLVEQPWRVAGRKVAGRPPGLDRAWLAVVAWLRQQHRPGRLVVGGRSAGARVACRTATEAGATAVLCLSFPLHPPGRPDSSRSDELLAPVRAGLPVLVVQGRKDPFGTPEEVAAVLAGAAPVTPVPGTHSLTAPAEVSAAVMEWLPGHG